MRFAFALLLAFGVATAAPVPREHRQRDEKQRLVGTWTPKDTKTAWFRFAADGTLETWNPPDPSIMRWAWTNLDTRSTPKRMTLTRVSDKQVYTCPFDWNGDTMVIAFCSSTDEPPADFAQRSADVRTLSRVK